MCKVSVIVPVHNSSETLTRCVDSILNQTHKNLEVILIENGSEDQSLQMCEDYAKADGRVKALSLQTRGISKARNAGLKCKTGEYFTFVDSDDCIEPDMIEKLLAEAEKSQADMTFCRYKNLKSNGEIFVAEERRLENVALHKQIKYLFLVGTPDHVMTVIWRILYKSSTFEGQLFNEDMTFSEDEDFLFNALAVSEKTSLIDEILYNYTYFYDNPGYRFKKYFSDIDKVTTTYKCLIESSYNACKKFNLDDFADAVIYYRFIAMVDKVLQHTDYKKKFKAIFKDGYWRNIDTKSRYKAYKKLFYGHSKLKAYLIRHRQFGLLKFLLKAKRRIRRK